MKPELIREILEEAYNRKIIGFGTLHIGIKALNNRKNKVAGNENDYTAEIKIIEMTEEKLIELKQQLTKEGEGKKWRLG